MVVVPLPAGVTLPAAGSMVATPALLLLHTPPVTASLKVIDSAIHNLVLPVMAAIGFTVTVANVLQPTDPV